MGWIPLNGMIGEVAWMDTLCNRFYGRWQIDIHPVHIVPFVREIHEAEKLHSASSAGSQSRGKQKLNKLHSGSLDILKERAFAFFSLFKKNQIKYTPREVRHGKSFS